MATITFLNPKDPGGRHGPVKLDRGQGDRTLMDLIEQHGIPHRCECRTGTCGRCAVKVAVLARGGRRPLLEMSPVERDTLIARGKLTRHQHASPLLAADRPQWRLACQFQPGEDDLVVAL